MTRLAHQSATYATLMMMMIGQCLCDNRNGIKPCKKSFLSFIQEMVCSSTPMFNVSLRWQIALPQSTKFQTADLCILSTSIIVVQFADSMRHSVNNAYMYYTKFCTCRITEFHI